MGPESAFSPPKQAQPPRSAVLHPGQAWEFLGNSKQTINNRAFSELVRASNYKPVCCNWIFYFPVSQQFWT